MLFKDKKILITGGAGFIGSHLVERVLGEGSEVICVDNFDDFYDPRIKERNIKKSTAKGLFTLYRDDIRDQGRMEYIFGKHDPDIVVHLAARAGVRPSIANPMLYDDINVKGTLVLLESMKKSGCKRMIFGSSSSVYGSSKDVPFKEDEHVLSPISPYAATKLAGEALCRAYHYLYGISIVCLRFFTVYGPRQRPEMAIHKFIRKIYNGDEITMFGNGGSARDYTFVDDIVDGIIGALECSYGFEIMNLGDSNPVKLSKLLTIIEKGSGLKTRIKKIGDQPGDVPITYASIDKAKKIIGYKPSVKIDEGIGLFIKWYSEQLKLGKRSTDKVKVR